MRNVIFLDLDGIVNTIQIHKHKLPWQRMIKKDGYYFDICLPSYRRVSNKQAVLWLEKLALETKSEIVITSSWRIGNSTKKIARALYNSGLSRKVKIIDSTKQIGRRDDEILEWVETHYVSNYVVLDDDCFDLEKVKDRLVQTKTDIGFTINEYNKAVEILTEKN